MRLLLADMHEVTTGNGCARQYKKIIIVIVKVKFILTFTIIRLNASGPLIRALEYFCNAWMDVFLILRVDIMHILTDDFLNKICL